MRIFQLTLCLVILLFVLPKDVPAKTNFYQVTRAAGITLHAAGTVTVLSPKKVELAYTTPVKDTFVFTGTRAEYILECLHGTPTGREGHAMVTLVQQDPRVIIFSLPGEATMTFTLEDKVETVISLAKLFRATLVDSKGRLPLVLHIDGDRALVLTNLLLPIGWVRASEGRVFQEMPILPDANARKVLSKIALAMAAGMPATYTGGDWRLEHAPLE